MISDATVGVAKYLHDKIESAYDCVPQMIRKRDSIGFNVNGREAGRVEQIDGHVYSNFIVLKVRECCLFLVRFLILI